MTGAPLPLASRSPFRSDDGLEELDQAASTRKWLADRANFAAGDVAEEWRRSILGFDVGG